MTIMFIFRISFNDYRVIGTSFRVDAIICYRPYLAGSTLPSVVSS